MKKLLQNDVFIGLTLSLAAFGVYLNTLASTVQFEDCGELAAAVSTLGITHPTGYPLLTLLGWLVAHIPIHVRVLIKLNVMVALFCSSAVFFFYRVFLFLLSKKTAASSHSLNRISAASGALVLAFSAAYWEQAVSFEVYALHLFFVSMLLLLFLRSLPEKKEKSDAGGGRIWYLFTFVLGLSFTNHMMTILLAPAFLCLYFSTHGFGRDSWVKIAKSALPFLIGLSLYLYLPLRASQSPIMNWGNVRTFELFWRHVTGEQYRYLMYQSFDVVLRQLQHFLHTFPADFGYVPLVFIPFGWLHLFHRWKSMLIFSILLFSGCLFYSFNYNISEVEPYFLLAYIAAVIWIVFGIRTVLEWGERRGIKWLVLVPCGLLFLCPLLVNYRMVDASRDYAVEDYARNMLESLEPNAVIYTNQSDYFTSQANYLQWVEGVRPDVVVLDAALLTSYWYFPQLETRYPGFTRNSEPQIAAFTSELNKIEFDHFQDYSGGAQRLVEVLQSFLGDSSRPVYVTSDIKREFTMGFHRVASGLAFRLFRTIPPTPVIPIGFSFRPILTDRIHDGQVRDWYAVAYLNQGLHAAFDMKDTSAALLLMRKALEVKPDFPQASDWLRKIGGT